MRRVALTPDNFPDRVLLKGSCGGGAYTADRAGKFYIIERDEGTMAELSSHSATPSVTLVAILCTVTLSRIRPLSPAE